MLEELLKKDTAESKKKKLSEQYGMIMNTDTERRVNVMCNLSEALVERTVEKTNEDTIELLIMDYLEEGKSREQIIQKLIKVFKIDDDKAASYFDKFNK